MARPFCRRGGSGRRRCRLDRPAEPDGRGGTRGRVAPRPAGADPAGDVGDRGIRAPLSRGWGPGHDRRGGDGRRGEAAGQGRHHLPADGRPSGDRPLFRSAAVPHLRGPAGQASRRQPHGAGHPAVAAGEPRRAHRRRARDRRERPARLLDRHLLRRRRGTRRRRAAGPARPHPPARPAQPAAGDPAREPAQPRPHPAVPAPGRRRLAEGRPLPGSRRSRATSTRWAPSRASWSRRSASCTRRRWA